MKLFLVNAAGDYPNQFPPLGLLYLASAARYAGHKVVFFDLGAANANQEDFRIQATAFKPEVFGISVYTTQIEKTYLLFREMRAHFPLAKIIVGGPHVSALPGETLKDCPEVDFEIVGEGEITLCELLDSLGKNEASYSTIAGLCFRNESGIVRNGPRDQVKNLDEIAFPAYDLIIPFVYSYDKFAFGKRVGIAVSSRGCPYNCTFCNKAVFGNKYRRRSPENVIRELKMQREVLGIDEIYFVDDLFVTNKKWLLEFFEAYNKSGLNLPWKCLGRVDQVDEPIYKKMKEHGCFLVQFGVESGDDEMLKKIKKNITTEKVATAVAAAQHAGLNVATYFILGHPGDTYDTVLRTIDFAVRINADVCHFFVLVPFPGTYNYTFLPDELKGCWSRIRYYHKGQYPISLCDLAPEELYQLEKQARFSFYGRLGYFFHNVLSFRYPLKITFIKASAFGAFFFAHLTLRILGRSIVSSIRKKELRKKITRSTRLDLSQ
jgi:anaerobic magnesium-protoporphyrin IX monomethyl ester cyclase